MDKHQRKRLSRWELKKAKDMLKFEEAVRELRWRRSYERAVAEVRQYDPPPEVVFRRAVSLLKDPIIPHLGQLRQGHWFLGEMGGEYHEIWWAAYNNRGSADEREVDIVVTRGKDRKLAAQALGVALDLARHTDRVNAIRDELTLKTNRFRAIQLCRYGFKEELMMKVWHPDRVGKFLETYGWEAFDNLLGVE
jgi:hypothetical protein